MKTYHPYPAYVCDDYTELSVNDGELEVSLNLGWPLMTKQEFAASDYSRVQDARKGVIINLDLPGVGLMYSDGESAELHIEDVIRSHTGFKITVKSVDIVDDDEAWPSINLYRGAIELHGALEHDPLIMYDENNNSITSLRMNKSESTCTTYTELFQTCHGEVMDKLKPVFGELD